jgi:hypothetical protein
MKKHEDYLATSLWYREEITDPYQVIAESYDFADVAFYRKLIKNVLLAAGSEKVCRKDDPGNLLYELKMLESVINAAYLINKEKKVSPFTIGEGDVFNKNLFCGRNGRDNEWDYFPRSLSMKEFIDPYLVFKRFFKYKDLDSWKEDLEIILNFALTKGSITGSGEEIDLLPIYIHLTKLVEAAHLIDVRETTHIDGRIKNRIAS